MSEEEIDALIADCEQRLANGALFCQECPQPVRSIHFDVTKREPAEDE